MAHVSRHTPVKRVSEMIVDRFVHRAVAHGSVEHRKRFLVDLLTPTERIMLSKRFAVIYMLVNGYSFDSIQEVLRVSPSTIARLWTAIQKGKHRALVESVRIPEQGKVSDILQFLADLMPPMNMSKKQYAARMRRIGL